MIRCWLVCLMNLTKIVLDIRNNFESWLIENEKLWVLFRRDILYLVLWSVVDVRAAEDVCWYAATETRSNSAGWRWEEQVTHSRWYSPRVTLRTWWWCNTKSKTVAPVCTRWQRCFESDRQFILDKPLFSLPSASNC